MEAQRKTKKAVCGVVVSRSGDKSIRIMLSYKIKHPVYGKYINRRTKLGVHDEKNQAAVGDVVEVVQCRRRAKTKSWRLVKIVEKAAEKELQ